MAEKLINFDPKTVLEQSKEILRGKGQLPSDCPKEDCLSLDSIKWDGRSVRVILYAQPPQLPTEKEWLKYEIHPVCDKSCGIHGNDCRAFEITQDLNSGKILSAEGEWKTSLSLY